MEVLLSIMILGIGVISIAALFPAGIIQQRLSVDEGVGPMVADNAISILRSKLRPEHFGTLEQHNPPPFVPRTVNGDWFWSRPAFYYAQATVSGVDVHPGDINIFGTTATQGTSINSEIPWNRILFPDTSSGQPNPPAIVITQGERYYPMAPTLAGPDGFMHTADDRMDDQAKRPQYVWDCMFRRFQGKILVTIFVYRANIPGGPSAPAYAVVGQPGSGAFAPLPYLQFIGPNSTYPAWMKNEGSAADPIAGNPANMYYNPADPNQAWQETRQWIIDQNNCIHRVLGAMRDNDNQPQTVQLVRPVPEMPGIPAYFTPTGPIGTAVDRIWYLPLEVNLDVNGDGIGDAGSVATLTPVYVTVKEL